MVALFHGHSDTAAKVSKSVQCSLEKTNVLTSQMVQMLHTNINKMTMVSLVDANSQREFADSFYV